ncbi:MAG: SsrA-binding protein SmpB [Planctomycetota bacterium]|nr:MAG: SsrA-binding protein SmpB [Planctomycetota bacterium]
MSSKKLSFQSNVLIKNRKAYHNFEILEELEAGLVLVGTEVKSLRMGKASLQEAYCRIQNEEIFLIGCHIPTYEKGTHENHDPLRKRKLLLHKHQIRRLSAKVQQQGLTIVPLKIYFRNGFAKVLIGLAKGKKLYDKREALKKKESRRAMERVLKRRR